MKEKLMMARNITEKYGQEHLLQGYDMLSKDEQNLLLDDILTIDFKEMKELYEKTKNK